ncbi:putative purine permease 11 [Iris pallida]|uniref:Probable purine permease n=1 Tax=Iris pallida TaxID=29817 RepID=A0AAX6G0J8_IRIPA|nr:putative purine permease 11 [Iris pallida]
MKPTTQRKILAGDRITSAHSRSRSSSHTRIFFFPFFAMGDVEHQTQAVPSSESKRWSWWLKVSVYTFFVLAGQTVATLLGRFYYDQGGNSKWMGALVTSAGFPLLLPLFLVASRPSAPLLLRSATYVAIGLMVSADNLMYSYALLYLPVSTFALVCASQLAFNAVFSYLLNSHKLTSLVLNSVVVLSFSAALLGVSPAGEKDDGSVDKDKYPLGFVLTLAASAAFSLILSLTQLAFQRVLKTDSFVAVLEMLTCTALVATAASAVGLFASGEARTLKGEMEGFSKGRAAYVTTLVSTAVCWTVSSVGLVGLTLAASSLFANVVSTVALPAVPVFAVVFFRDEMDGVKVVAMLMAIWGFLSYIYQDYLDDVEAKAAIAAPQPAE